MTTDRCAIFSCRGGLNKTHDVLHFRTHHHPAINFRDEPPQRLWDRYVVKCDNTAPMVAFSVCYQGRKVGGGICAIVACVCEPASPIVGRNRSCSGTTFERLVATFTLLARATEFLHGREQPAAARWRPPPLWDGGCSPLLAESSTTLQIASESSWPCRAGSTRRSPRIC